MSIATRLWLTIVASIVLVLGLGAFLRVRAEQGLLMEATLRDRLFFGRALNTVLSAAPSPEASARALLADDTLRRSHIDVSVDHDGAEPTWLREGSAEQRASFARNEVVVSTERRRIRTLVPVMHNARRLVIELDEPLDVHGAIERLALVASLLQALAMAILAGGIAWIVVRRMLGRPLSALADYARKIGRGELDARTTVHSRNEVGVLAAEMNAMAGQLSAARRALEEAATERVFLQESLRHGDRLRTVGQLAASLAHELGTPLNTVLGHGRMIERRTTQDDPANASAKMIIEQAQRMAGLIRELLDFGRKKTSERVAQDVVLLVQKTWHLLEPIARKTGAEFVLDAPSAARAQVDGGQLLQVLTNLVMNAMQSMPRGGVVRARVNVEAVEPPAEVRARGARYVHVAIEDRGTGIAQEDLLRVFEPFFTSKGEGEGTGLGLSVAEGIVRAHDGWITIESTVGHGTTVHVFLPATA